MSFEILATGEHETDRKAFSNMITSRQKEVLEAGLSWGIITNHGKHRSKMSVR